MTAAKRWYDAHGSFAVQLERLKTAKKRIRDRTVAGVLAIINDDAPNLLETYLLDFPLDQKKRRWYDQDPYLWLMVNGLEHAPALLLDKVTAYLEKSGRVPPRKKTRNHTKRRMSAARKKHKQPRHSPPKRKRSIALP